MSDDPRIEPVEDLYAYALELVDRWRAEAAGVAVVFLPDRDGNLVGLASAVYVLDYDGAVINVDRMRANLAHAGGAGADLKRCLELGAIRAAAKTRVTLRELLAADTSGS